MKYCGIAGMTASEWVKQILGHERETSLYHKDVMNNLRIGGWSHSYHYDGNFGIVNTQHAFERLTEYVQLLAVELDRRLHELTAVEEELKDMIKEASLPPLV